MKAFEGDAGAESAALFVQKSHFGLQQNFQEVQECALPFSLLSAKCVNEKKAHAGLVDDDVFKHHLFGPHGVEELRKFRRPPV